MHCNHDFCSERVPCLWYGAADLVMTVIPQPLAQAGISLEYDGRCLVVRDQDANACPIRNRGGEALASFLSSNPDIKVLDIRDSNINDNGLAQICLTLRQSNQLEELHANTVGHTGLEFLLGFWDLAWTVNSWWIAFTIGPGETGISTERDLQHAVKDEIRQYQDCCSSLKILRLEEALDEARRAGSTVPDQLQQAILLKRISGQLRTHLNMDIQDATAFKELREHILRWDRSQQKWSNLIFSEDASGSAPMEVDRVFSAGKKGGKYKGKGYSQKGQQQQGKSKGKSKSKQDGKTSFKGKQNGEYKGKYGGKPNDGMNWKGKGGSNKTDQVCHRCGKPGHFARECWSSVRNVQGDFHAQ
eukprot:s291_g3.t1